MTIRRLAIALAISVALNLLFVGIWIGRAFDRHHGPPPDRGGFGERALRDDGLRELIRGSKLDLRGRRDATRAARAKVREALEREPFDRAALDESLRALRAETSSSQEALHRALADAAEKGGPEVRRRIAKAFSRGDRRGWR